MNPLFCRLLPYSVADGPANMAADEVLLEAAAAEGIASLRFYGWSQPTLSLGYFQPGASRRDPPVLQALSWVRRPSGGAALVHHHELTYALALPAGPPWQRQGESWLRRMHGLIRDALVSFGLVTQLCNEERKLGEMLCFLHQTPGDLLLRDAKVAGSAQRKQRGALVQHGGILLATSLYAPNLPGIRDLTGEDISADALGAALTEQLAQHTGWLIEATDWSPAERRRIEELVADKYTQPAWNDKR